MSDRLPGNPYANSTAIPSGSYAVSELHTKATVALVQATLALAYEQRTANLIAMLDHAHPTVVVELAVQIRARLGLDKDSTR